jgi:hypothetical protein
MPANSQSPLWQQPSPEPLGNDPRQQSTSDAVGTQQPPQAGLPASNVAEVLESEWVVAAKKILQTNAGDPFLQSRGMALLRSDYMKKRYNKDVKIPEN